MYKRSGLSAIAAGFFGLALAVSSQAGVLDSNPNALTSGTAAFDNGNNLSGTVDYAVFTASAFNTAFPAASYVPGDAYVYAYQVLNGGSDNFSSLVVGITNPANTIGTFNIGDIDASLAAFDGSGNAEFQFLSPEIQMGESSYGLVFSAPTLPEPTVGVITDGGGFLQIDLVAPGVIPEPATVSLILLTSIALVGRSRRR